MKKTIFAILFSMMCCGVFGGQVSIPRERIALPQVSGNHLVCVWDETAGVWLESFKSYDHTGTYDFQVPEWGRWYLVGLWDSAAGAYVFGKWVGHFPFE